MRCSIVILAAERYRRAKGRWPTSLQDLVPQYLSSVPIDLFDGKPIKMKPTKDGIIIYSIGLDEQDDGGTLVRGGNYLKMGTDLGSQLWNVENRRQPYRPAPKER